VPSIIDKRLVFVTGKGGVGKTTVSAAIARLAVRRGKRVLICEINTDPSMTRIFGSDAIGFAPRQVDPGIWACNLTGQESMRAFVRRFVPSRRVADLIMSNRVANVFFQSAPSVMEAVILDQLCTLLNQSKPSFDLLIVDLPASGHAVTFLNVPRSMTEMVRVGDLAAHMRTLATLLADPAQSELLLVTLPEEMSVNETLELLVRARAEVETPLRTVVVNGERLPDLESHDPSNITTAASTIRSGEVDPLADAVDRVAHAVALGAYWRERDRENTARLEERDDIDLQRVPFYFHKVDERELVERVADAIGGAL